MNFASAPALRGIEKFPLPRKAIYRARIINPQNEDQCDYYDDGGLAVGDDGTVRAIGDFSLVAAGFADRYEVVDQTQDGERPTIIPGLYDLHVHGVQNRVRGQFAGSLMPWLEHDIWPEEARYKDAAFADEQAEIFAADLARQGTTVAAIYSSIHEQALRAIFKHAAGRVIAGNVIMTEPHPPYLRQEPEEALAMTDRLAREFGPSYAVTPRFAPSCSAEVMAAAARIAQNRGVWTQTHLSENHDGTEHDEVELVKRLFPDAASYTDVYARAGLLGRKTIMAHVIHASDAELDMLAQTGTCIAHCPTSNEALESGRMPVERILQYGILYGLGSDVGAGPSLSMLHVMQAYRNTHRDHIDILPAEALYRGTLAGAEILGLDDVTGNLNRGKEATFAVLKSSGTHKHADANDAMAEVLAGTQADFESMVKQTYIAGRQVFLRSSAV